MSNSPLVNYTKISPNRSSPRNHKIDTITIHCVVGQCSVETLGNVFAPTSRQASSNYGVGVDGRIGMYVEEKDRSWCSSNAANDNRAITIEVASDTTEPYAVNSKAYAALLDLVTDICKRNGIKELIWSWNKSERVNHTNGCNMTVHRDYANKSCPGTYLYERHAQIAAEVNKRLKAAEPTPAPAPAPAPSTGLYASKVIAVAAGEVGYHEKKSNSDLDSPTGNTGSGNYTKYARDFDTKYPNWYNGKKNGFAWCDMFVDWVFLTAFGYEAALKLLCQPEKSCGAGCTYSAGYYKAKGQFHTSGPKPGDQIFFGTGLSNCTHTGIVEKVDSSKVYTIEGNTSDQVARRSYSLGASNIVGYGRPAYDAETGGSTPSPTPSTGLYRVRKSWDDMKSQKGAFKSLANAKACADKNPGYSVYDESGKAVYPTSTPAPAPAPSTTVPYLVEIKATDLNIRKGPGTNYATTGKYTGKGVFTIVEEKSGQGSVKGWGKLKSGAGWISLDYTTKL
jgi:hypothetical protein|nr:MAG TPA: hypothetical protein [Caudoviricetes sp.]